MRSAWSNSRPAARALVCNAAVVLVVATSLIALVPASGDAAEKANGSGLLARPDSALLSIWNTARELLDQDRHSDAVRLLVSILEAEEDYFIAAERPDGSTGGYKSLKNEVRSQLGRLAPAAREAYELQFGSLAGRRLEEALATGNIERISDVQRRYCHTTAGYEALYVLGNHYLDDYRFLTAAQCFQDLQATGAAARYEPYLSLKLAVCWLRAGEPARARGVLAALQKQFPDARFKLGGRTVELFRPPDDALEWLQRFGGGSRDLGNSLSVNWPMVRHDPARQGRGSGGRALFTQPVWRQAVSESFELELTLQAQRAEFFRASRLALPSVMPLAVDDLIVMRTPQRLAAVDFQTGKRIWQVDQPDQPSAPVAPSKTEHSRSSAATALNQRLWLDKTYGSLSSDGHAVFVIEGFGMLPGPDDNRKALAQRFQNGMNAGIPYNVLSAYELRSRQGKRLWSVSALRDNAPPAERLFFLGPPLPLEGHLYSLVEIRDEIRLLVLGSRNGALLWSQPLALVPPERSAPTLRRTSGLSPSFAHGILICPTGVGAAVAINLTTRNLLWAYEYPVTRPVGRTLAADDTWADSCAVISGRRVLITPAESLQMHCLHLMDGSPQWSLDRGDLAFLACADRGVAVVVGNRQLTAITLDTGKFVAGWPLKLPDNSLPSGRGYFDGGHYHLPLNVAGAGELAAIQLDPPAIVHRSQWLRGAIPGNLICHRGQVLSQNVDWLEYFARREPLEWDADLGSRARFAPSSELD